MMASPSRFGTRGRAIIAGVPTPLTRAASMNSRLFSARVWPRTMRAISSQDTAPMATKISSSSRPNKGDKIHHTNKAHQQPSGPPADVTGRGAPEDPDQHTDDTRRKPDEQ